MVNRKRRQLIGAGIILLFLVFSISAFRNALTPYVNFAQAKTTQGSVQVRGVVVPLQEVSGENSKGLTFALQDEAGDIATVVYAGAKPEGFDQATSLVAIGTYRQGQFVAEKLLVKCPSKYQGSVKE